MKLAFTTLGCPDWDLDTIIARAAAYEFDGVDFRGVSGEMEIWKLPEFSERLTESAAQLQAAGLEVPCMSSSARLLADTDDAREKSAANLAATARVGAALGAKYVRVFGGHNGSRSYADALREAASTLDAMARIAAPLGLIVLVETHDDWIATDKLCELLDAATEPNIGAIWDVNHPFRKAGEPPERSWAQFGRHVRYVHIKDTHRTANGKDVPCLLGRGEVPLAETLRVLRAGGYDGWLAYEWEKKWHPEIEEPEIAFPQSMRFIRALLG